MNGEIESGRGLFHGAIQVAFNVAVNLIEFLFNIQENQAVNACGRRAYRIIIHLAGQQKCASVLETDLFCDVRLCYLKFLDINL
jgi:hypothetical protein